MTKEDYRHSRPLRVNIIQDGFFILQQALVAFPVRNMGQLRSVRTVATQVCGHHRIPGFLEILRKGHVPVLVLLHAVNTFYHSFRGIGFINSQGKRVTVF